LDEPENSILMYRPTGVQTVSITQMIISNHSQTIQFQYNELGNKDIQHRQLTFGEANVLA
jgi:hypothetical protein